MATFKGFAMKKIGETGWVEKEVPECGPMDAIVRPTCVSPCTSDIHTVWEGAIGERTDMVLGHVGSACTRRIVMYGVGTTCSTAGDELNSLPS